MPLVKDMSKIIIKRRRIKNNGTKTLVGWRIVVLVPR